ncbi:MAG: HEAT repeat domain-containing protein [Limnospira sp.]
MTISIFTTDHHLNVRSWDSQLAEMTGLRGEEVYGLPLEEVIPDLKSRGLLQRFWHVLETGAIETLAPALHNYLIPCPPSFPSPYFDYMQQRVTIAPLREQENIVGLVITLEDVTERQSRERELARVQNSPPASETLQTPASYRPLLEDLQDRHWQIRARAVEHLAKCDTPEVNAELLELLRRQHRNPSILNSVLQVLALSKVDTIPVLMECLQDEDPDLRIYVAQILGNRPDSRAIPPLIGLLDDSNPNVRYHAIESLGRLQAIEAVDRLIQIAESEDFFLAFPALDALMQMADAKLTPHLVPLLQKTLNWQLRREAVDNLAVTDDPELIRSLLRLMREQHRNPSVLNATLQILALSNVDPVPALVECLKDSDPDLRIYTALALGERHDRRGIEPLIELLGDPDVNVRYHAIESLGQLRAREAVEALVNIARSGDFFLAFPAIESLVRIGDASIVPRLLPLLEDDLLSLPVIEAFGTLGDADAIAPLAAQLNRPDPPVREIVGGIASIYRHYERLGEGTHVADLARGTLDPAGIENLLGAVRQTPLPPEELEGLVLMLGWLEGEAVERTLSELLSCPEVRDRVIEALVRYGPRVAPLLISELDAVELETRKAAVTILGRVGSTRAVPPLTSLLANAKPELVMATTAALAQIGDGRAYEALLELLGHPDSAVRLGAVAALNSLGHPAMPEHIYCRLTDPDPRVRESAVKIAGYFAFQNCVDRLLACTQDSVDRVARAAVEHLPYLEDVRVLPTLVEALAASSSSRRAAAAHSMGELEDTRTLPHLLQALEDPDHWVRYQAARSLGRYDYYLIDTLEGIENRAAPASTPSESEPGLARRVFVALEGLADGDPVYPVRAAATESLGRIGGAKATPILARLAETDDPEGDVARAALRALGRINRAQAVPPLLTALNSPNPERRLDALHAFRERGGEEAGVALQWMAAADPEERVVVAAIESLSRIATPEAISALLELTVDPSIRETCLDALVTRSCPQHLQAEYIELIAEGLRHVHPGVRCSVVEVLRRLKHPLASEYLIEALGDPDHNVRLAAVNALVYLGNRTCEAQLARLARSDPSAAIRRVAHRGLQS